MIKRSRVPIPAYCMDHYSHSFVVKLYRPKIKDKDGPSLKFMLKFLNRISPRARKQGA